MGQNDMLCLAVKAVEQPFGDIFIRQMTEPGKNSLLQFPGIILDRLEHIAAVVRLDYNRRTATQTLSDQGRDVTEIHQRRDLDSGVGGRESEVVHRVMRHRERMKVNIADAKVVSRVDLNHSISQGV